MILLLQGLCAARAVSQQGRIRRPGASLHVPESLVLQGIAAEAQPTSVQRKRKSVDGDDDKAEDERVPRRSQPSVDLQHQAAAADQPDDLRPPPALFVKHVPPHNQSYEDQHGDVPNEAVPQGAVHNAVERLQEQPEASYVSLLPTMLDAGGA